MSPAPQSHPGIAFRNIVPTRSGTTQEWTDSTLILRPGELGYDEDTDELKKGNGTDLFADLPPVGSGGSVNVGHEVAGNAFAIFPGITLDESGTPSYDPDVTFYGFPTGVTIIPDTDPDWSSFYVQVTMPAGIYYVDDFLLVTGLTGASVGAAPDLEVANSGGQRLEANPNDDPYSSGGSFRRQTNRMVSVGDGDVVTLTYADGAGQVETSASFAATAVTFTPLLTL